MTKAHQTVVSRHATDQGTLRLYISGFTGSLILTLTAYTVVTQHLSTNNSLMVGIIIGLALTQFIVQLVCFLHLGLESKPRWKLLVFGFMITVVMLLVFGSLWIMSNLNYRMTPAQITQYLNSQDGF